METINIKRSNIKDINDIYLIEIVSFKKPWNYIYFYSCFIHPNIKIYKALLKNKIVGFIIINEEEEASIHILNLAVHPDYRNKKIASNLLNHVIALYKNNYKKFYLEVRISNEIAISLYKKFGFKIEKIIKNYYGENEDAYLMILEIY
ncbi:MAG: ribosomal protein S18-alanine N-acetyltransferase [Spirochaetes bacterium]|nr:ribosomal protein S18-alanine N-acetyltransferase [Spirochaetota bacterium]